jgi:hypothetical protein
MAANSLGPIQFVLRSCKVGRYKVCCHLACSLSLKLMPQRGSNSAMTSRSRENRSSGGEMVSKAKPKGR